MISPALQYATLSLKAFAHGLKPLRAGIVGLDTSHVPAFTKLFNKGETEGELAGIKVTTGYTGGTDMPASATRKEKFTQQLREMGVEIVPIRSRNCSKRSMWCCWRASMAASISRKRGKSSRRASPSSSTNRSQARSPRPSPSWNWRRSTTCRFSAAHPRVSVPS
jgi:hypothetical protein